MSQNVYLSLTTSPKRISHISKLLSELEESLDLFETIFLNIPSSFGRNKTLYKIPNDLKSFPKLQINRFPKDFGPISKILPSLNFCKNPNDIIISIDDDIKHDKNIFSILINTCNKTDSVVTGIGKSLDYWSTKKFGNLERASPFEFKPKSTSTDILEGFSGVAYKRKCFPNLNLLEKLSKLSVECFLSDDLVLSFYLKLFGYRIISLFKSGKYGYPNFGKTKFKLHYYQWGLQNDALHKGGGLNIEVKNTEDINKIKYAKAYKTLQKYYSLNFAKINKIILSSWHLSFDKMVIINMKQKPNRKTQSLNILKFLNVPKSKIKIQEAITPKQNLVREFNKLGFPGNSLKYFISPKRFRDLEWHQSRKAKFPESLKSYNKILTELAVSLSQLKVIKYGMETNQTILMLEDDFGPTSSFYNIHSHRLNKQFIWETLYLGDCRSMRSGKKKTLISGQNNSIIQQHAVCHHSIAFKPSMGQRLFGKNTIIPFDNAIDDELSTYLKKHKVPFGIYDNQLMIQDVKLGANSAVQNQNKIFWELQASNKFGKLNLRKI